jgi:hypothetical protein
VDVVDSSDTPVLDLAGLVVFGSVFSEEPQPVAPTAHTAMNTAKDQ